MAIGRSSLSWGVLAPVAEGSLPPGGTSSPPAAPGVPPLPAATPSAPAPAGGTPFAVFDSQSAFEERMARAQRAHLREQFGSEDPAEVRTRLERLRTLEAAEEERRRAALTAEQKLQSDLEAEKRKREAAEAERDQVRFEGIVARSCAGHGIKNVAYAQFTVAQAAEALPDGEQLDVDKYLEGLLGKQEFRGAFGITEPTTQTLSQPVTTSPDPGRQPPPPPAPNGAPPAVDAMSMNPASFREHLNRIGVP